MTARFLVHGHFLSGPTYKVGLMLSLTGEPFSFRLVDLMAGAQRSPAYLEKARFGQVPCLEDLQNGRSLVQSAAILDYLADRTGKLGGASYDERLAAREWLFWDFDRLAPFVFRARMIAFGFGKAAPEVVEDLHRIAGLGLKLLNGHLTGRDFVVGEHPTIADVDLYVVLAFAGDAKIDLAPYPALAPYMARIEALPGFATLDAVLPKADRDA